MYVIYSVPSLKSGKKTTPGPIPVETFPNGDKESIAPGSTTPSSINNNNNNNNTTTQSSLNVTSTAAAFNAFANNTHQGEP